MSEYEVIAVPDEPLTRACEDCVFFCPNPSNLDEGFCLNEYKVMSRHGTIERVSSLPFCSHLYADNDPDLQAYSATYKLAHKVSGAVLTDQEARDLVNHYKQNQGDKST